MKVLCPIDGIVFDHDRGWSALQRFSTFTNETELCCSAPCLVALITREHGETSARIAQMEQSERKRRWWRR